MDCFNWFHFLDQTLKETPVIFLDENKTTYKFLKTISIDLVFYVDFKYGILFYQNPKYSYRVRSKMIRKCTLCTFQYFMHTLDIVDHFKIKQITYNFIAFPSLYQMVSKRAWLTRNWIVLMKEILLNECVTCGHIGGAPYRRRKAIRTYCLP